MMHDKDAQIALVVMKFARSEYCPSTLLPEEKRRIEGV